MINGRLGAIVEKTTLADMIFTVRRARFASEIIIFNFYLINYRKNSLYVLLDFKFGNFEYLTADNIHEVYILRFFTTETTWKHIFLIIYLEHTT